MKELTRTMVVRNRCGLHARPAAQVVRTLYRFGAEACVRLGTLAVDGRSFVALLTLGAKKGSVLTVSVAGERALEAANALQLLFDSSFYETE